LNPKSLSPKPKSFFSERGKSKSKEREKKEEKKKNRNNLWSHKKCEM
jgi:hypothetical protein